MFTFDFLCLANEVHSSSCRHLSVSGFVRPRVKKSMLCFVCVNDTSFFVLVDMWQLSDVVQLLLF